jgi:hypothetical protein
MTTGFTHFEFDIAGKWLELLKEISPSSRQVAFLVLPEHPATPGFLRTADRVAASLGLGVIPIGIHDVPEIERGISSVTSLARGEERGRHIEASVLAISTLVARLSFICVTTGSSLSLAPSQRHPRPAAVARLTNGRHGATAGRNAR